MRTITMLIACVFAMAFATTSAHAAQTPTSADHFEGGQNLSKGNVKGSDKHLAQVLQDKLDYSNLVVLTSAAGAGGAASAALTVTGLKTTDVILSVVQKTKGANNLPLLGWTTVAANALTVQWSADPGAGTVIVVTVKRP